MGEKYKMQSNTKNNYNFSFIDLTTLHLPGFVEQKWAQIN